MLMPSIFRTNSLIDDLFDDDWFDDKEFKNVEKKLYGHRAKNVMNTDVKETEDGYELEMDKDEKEKESGRYIRRERYSGACERSFYVGEEVTQQDIKASFSHGILKLDIPKKEAKKIEQNNFISIE